MAEEEVVVKGVGVGVRAEEGRFCAGGEEDGGQESWLG